jgi:hypothetical protein
MLRFEMYVSYVSTGILENIQQKNVQNQQFLTSPSLPPPPSMFTADKLVR